MEPHREGEYAFYYQVGMQTHDSRYVVKIEGRLDTFAGTYWYDIYTIKDAKAPKTEREITTSVNVRAISQIHFFTKDEKK